MRLLGPFRLLSSGHAVALPGGGKAEVLLSVLALRAREGATRDLLLACLWPTHDPAHASQSLHTLVYSLHKRLGGVLGDGTPILHAAGVYRLNCEAGVGVAVACFDALAARGEAAVRRDDQPAAMAAFGAAVDLYHGDLCVDMDIYAVVERERVRARYLTMLAKLADQYHDRGDYAACLDYAQRLLARDPCREDAHRLVMRCHVKRGERAQALRHYHLCAAILRSEFDTAPEPTTTSLYEQVRVAPSSL